MRRPICGVCVDDHTVSMSLAGSWLAVTPRVSIAMPPPRCCHMRSSNTCAASANAASTSPYCMRTTAAMLSSVSECARGASGLTASRQSETAGSTS